MAAVLGMLSSGFNPVQGVTSLFSGGGHHSSGTHQSIMPVNPFEIYNQQMDRQQARVDSVIDRGVGGATQVVDHVGGAGAQITGGIGQSLDGLMSSPGFLILGLGAIFLLINKN